MSSSKTGTSSVLVGLSTLSLAALHPQVAQAQSLSCPQTLSFGAATACGTAGTIVVRPDNTRSVTGACLTLGGAPFSRARCNISQSFPFQPVQISVNTAKITLSTSGAANSMTVTNFNIMTNTNGRTFTTTTAFVTVPIGATLNVNASQPQGTYTGSFTVNAVFQ